VIRGKDGRYLGHDLAWYTHAGPEEAYVFTAEMILARDWGELVAAFIPASYEHKTDVTLVTGAPIIYEAYLAQCEALAA